MKTLFALHAKSDYENTSCLREVSYLMHGYVACSVYSLYAPVKYVFYVVVRITPWRSELPRFVATRLFFCVRQPE